MTTIMRIALAVLVLVAASCGSDGDDASASGDGGSSATDTIATIPITEPPDVPSALVGSWTVVTAGDADAPDGVTLTISSGGGVTGFLGCNEFFGSVSTADGALRFVEVSYAEIGCPDREDFVALVDALDQVVSVEATDGEASATLSSPDSVVVVLERSDDVAPA